MTGKNTTEQISPAAVMQLERAEFHQAVGRLADAAVDYHAAIELDPSPRSQLAFSRFLSQSDCPQAAESLLKALVDRARREQDGQLMAVAAGNLACVLRECGRFAEAAGWQQRSLAAEMQRQSTAGAGTSEPGELATDLINLAGDAIAAGRLSLAESLATRALQLGQSGHDQPGEAAAWGVLGLVALQQQKLDNALTLLGRAFRLHCTLQDAEAAGRDLLNLAETCHRMQRWHSAARCLKHAADRFRETGCVRLLQVAMARLKEAQRFFAVTTLPPTLN